METKLQVAEVELDLEKAQEVWREFESFKEKLLDDRDRYEVKGKRWLNRQGCAKLATVFSLSEPEQPQVITVPLNDKHVGFITITAVETPGRRRAFGVGGCTTHEILTKDQRNRRAFHDAVAVSHTRAKERAIADLVGGGELTAEEIGMEAEYEVVREGEPF
ncbi:MAG: hypothetical protein ACE5KR_00795 [Candidatus Bipolaricaulia bacterium]